MPIYEYECPKCKSKVEIIQKINDPAPICKKCGSKLKKLISLNHFILVGNCWAKDNYSSKPKTKPKTKKT
ncbi:MAG: zinc ribbon domain-containing protein [Nitrospiraceae bacterium]|nr:zinc ribbon domain-containing protein [Nitrospiraceae bacterium]